MALLVNAHHTLDGRAVQCLRSQEGVLPPEQLLMGDARRPTTVAAAAAAVAERREEGLELEPVIFTADPRFYSAAPIRLICWERNELAMEGRRKRGRTIPAPWCCGAVGATSSYNSRPVGWRLTLWLG